VSEPRPVTLITGASAGIGWALAEVFAAHGHELVLVARREAALARLADAIAAKGAPAARPIVLALDLAPAGAGERVAAALAERGLAPRYVVNNAGFGLIGPAATLDRAEQLAMIDLNIRTLTDLSLAFVASLERHRGGILNVASVAGFLSGPGMAVYYATKAFVLSFSEALHAELKPRGVRVTALCPGPVPTEFQDRAGIPRRPGPMDRSAEMVAHAGYDGLMRGRRVIVPGWQNRFVTRLPRLLPRGAMLELVRRSQFYRFERPPLGGGPARPNGS
jgi:short-subunit dehydrogenase